MKLSDAYLRDTLSENALLRNRLEQLRGASVLVTGGTGIVGTAVAKVADLAGAEVFAHARTPFAGAELAAGPGVTWSHGDLASVLAAMRKYDFVFHCATFGQPEKFSAEWRETVSLNVEVLMRLLDLATKLGFASTSEIYSGLTVPGAERMNGLATPQHPRSGYIESKRMGEAICFHSGHAVANRIALASGPYPKADDSRAIYQIIRRARRDGFVSLQGGGSNVRQYQYSLACAIRFIVTTAFGSQGVYNNAGPYSLSMSELAKWIADELGVEFRGGAEGSGLAGAPSVVSVDMSRLSTEFPELDGVDPPIDVFVKAIIEAADAYA